MFKTRAAMKAVYPDGPTAFFLIDATTAIILPPKVFCCEECMAEWIKANGLPPGSRQNRSWEFVKGKPKCEQCDQLLYEKNR